MLRGAGGRVVRFDDLTPLGPVTVLKLRFSPTGYERSIVAEG